MEYKPNAELEDKESLTEGNEGTEAVGGNWQLGAGNSELGTGYWVLDTGC